MKRTPAQAKDSFTPYQVQVYGSLQVARKCAVYKVQVHSIHVENMHVTSSSFFQTYQHQQHEQNAELNINQWLAVQVSWTMLIDMSCV